MDTQKDYAPLTAADADDLRAGTGAPTYSKAADIAQAYADFYDVCDGREKEAAWMRSAAGILRDAATDGAVGEAATPARWINGSQLERDHNGLRNTCSACGHDGTEANPLTLSDDGFRVHQAHTRDRDSGYYGAEQGCGVRQQAANASDDSNGW